jgi:pimeloyl-ACP methyl ester carboxylesterase
VDTVDEVAAGIRWLARPDGRLAYDVRGTGPLVVCAPGMGDLRSVYRALVPLLVDAGYRVATVDLRGHGDSDTTFADHGDVPTGEDLLALAEHLGAPAVLVGNSMSAGAAVWAAAERPDLVAGLVLIAPFVRDLPVSRLQALALRLALLRPWGARAWTAYYRTLYPDAPPADLDTHRAAIRTSLARPGGWRSFVATTRTSHAPAEARLDDVAVPTLVVMGTADPDFPDPAAEARLVADRLTGELQLVEAAGHYPQAERPEVVGPRIATFLEGIHGRA